MNDYRYNSTVMVDPRTVALAEYDRLKDVYAILARQLAEYLRRHLLAAGMDYHAIEHRAKDAASVADKLRRREIERLSDITDLAGVRVIVYYGDDVDRVSRLITAEFPIDAARSVDKRAELQVDQFGYQSVHHILRIPEHMLPSPNSLLAGRLVELQVRTVLQHAWAAISHRLDYKSTAHHSSVIRRQLFGLASVMEIADREFINIREALRSETRGQNVKPETVGHISLRVYLASSSIIGEICDIARLGNFEPVRHIERPDDRTVPRLLILCRELKIETIEELDKQLRSGMRNSRPYLARIARESQFLLATEAELAAMLLVRKHHRQLSKLLETRAVEGWPHEKLTSIIQLARSKS